MSAVLSPVEFAWLSRDGQDLVWIALGVRGGGGGHRPNWAKSAKARIDIFTSRNSLGSDQTLIIHSRLRYLNPYTTASSSFTQLGSA